MLKKKDIYYIYFWFFLTSIVIFLSLMLLTVNAYVNQESIIRNRKQEYQGILDLEDTKIYINNKIVKNDREIKEFLKDFRMKIMIKKSEIPA